MKRRRTRNPDSTISLSFWQSQTTFTRIRILHFVGSTVEVKGYTIGFETDLVQDFQPRVICHCHEVPVYKTTRYLAVLQQLDLPTDADSCEDMEIGLSEGL
jgi:hypothetical protein